MVTKVNTSSTGVWHAEVASGLVAIDVDERTLPFAQPYLGKATQGDVVSVDTRVAANLEDTVEMSFVQFGAVTGAVNEILQNGTGNLPIHAAIVRLTDFKGAQVLTQTDEFGVWVASLPYGSYLHTPHVPPHVG